MYDKLVLIQMEQEEGVAMSAIVQAECFLKQKKEQVLKTQQALKEEAANLPKGIVRKLQTDSGEYFQFQYYCADTKKNGYKHIGKDPAVADAMQREIYRRRELESEIKELTRELEIIDKMLKLASKHLEPKRVLESLKALEAERDPSTPPPNNAPQERNP